MASLEERVAKLEQQMKGTLKLAPHQAGPLPGWFRAARIDGNQMVINMTDSKAGIAPRISVTDATGRTRAEMGNLAASGSSPAQYGFRALAANGTVIFDSTGYVAVETFLGLASANPAVTVTSLTPVTVTGSGLDFTLNRAGFLRISTDINASATGGAGTFAYISLALTGPSVWSGQQAIFDRGVTGYSYGIAPLEFLGQILPAGSYHLEYQAYVDNAALTLNVAIAQAFVYLQGTQ